MSQYSPPPPPAPPPPPTSGALDDDLFAAPPAWPKVIGIISIVLGALNLTCMGCNVLNLAVFMPMAESQMKEPIPPPMQPGPLHWALMGLGFVLALLLLAAGIVTVMRRPAGRALHLGYALVSIPLTIASVAIQVQQINDMAQWAANNPDSAWAQQLNAPGAAVGQWAGLIIGTALGLAYPTFLLIWFGFVKRRAEDMTGRALEPAA